MQDVESPRNQSYLCEGSLSPSLSPPSKVSSCGYPEFQQASVLNMSIRVNVSDTTVLKSPSHPMQECTV